MRSSRTATHEGEREMAGTATRTKTSSGFSAGEKAAMRERAKETRRGAKSDGESDLRAKIAEMSKADRQMAERFDAIVRRSAPELAPTTWYGMPAYTKAGKIVCHFQPAAKFKTRYATFGFSDKATLDDGNVWPVAYAVTEFNTADEKRIGELLKRAAGS